MKRLDHVIRAAAKLHEKYPELSLTFYGYGDAETEPKLKDLVKKLQAENYILFGGFKQDLTDVYNNAWLEALTSQYEELPWLYLKHKNMAVLRLAMTSIMDRMKLLP